MIDQATTGSVLVVGDRPEHLRLASGALSERGYAVRLLPAGGAPLAAALATPPDVMLLDVGLAGLDGYALCAELRADPRTSEVAVIFCSGPDAALDRARASAAGGADHLTRPFDDAQVLARVAAQVELVQLRRRLREQSERLERVVAERDQAELELTHANRELRRHVAGLGDLNQIAGALANGGDLPAALGAVGPHLARLFDGACVTVWLHDTGGAALGRIAAVTEGGATMGGPSLALDDDPLAAQVLERGAPRSLAPSAEPPPIARLHPHPPDGPAGGCMLVPLSARGGARGLLCVRSAERERMYTLADLAMARTVASNIAGALEGARLFDRVRADAAEEERRRLGLELHDSVGHALFLANLNAEVLPQLWEQSPAKARRALGDLQLFTRSALGELRALLVELRPSALAHTPLADLLRNLASAVGARHPLAVSAELERVPLLPAEVQVALYRIAQEAVHNVVKHAQAGRLSLSLSLVGPRGPGPCAVEIGVADDGRGFDPGPPTGGLGLGGMAERASDIGATLAISSRPGAGTRVVVTWRGPAAQP